MDSKDSNPAVVCAFDLDNTLYDFVEFFGPAFRGMLSALSKSTGVATEELIESAKQVFEEEGYLEYPFLVRRIHSFNHLPATKIAELEQLAAVVFRRVRERRLKAYPLVHETLDELTRGGIVLAAVTNAPTYHAYKRLVFLGIAKYFDILIGIENPTIPAGVKIESRVAPWEGRKGLQTLIVPRALGKPSDHPYSLLHGMFSTGSSFYSVGDSVERDLAPAARSGYTTVWAKYGKVVDSRNYATVLQLTPKAVIKTEVGSFIFAPDHEIDNINELLDIIRPTKQLTLF